MKNFHYNSTILACLVVAFESRRRLLFAKYHFNSKTMWPSIVLTTHTFRTQRKNFFFNANTFRLEQPNNSIRTIKISEDVFFFCSPSPAFCLAHIHRGKCKECCGANIIFELRSKMTARSAYK